MHEQEERTLPSTPPTIAWLGQIDGRMDRMEKVMANVDSRSVDTHEIVRHLKLHFFYVPVGIGVLALLLSLLSYRQSDAAEDRIDRHIEHHRDAGR